MWRAYDAGMRPSRPGLASVGIRVAAITMALAVASAGVAVLEHQIRIDNASSVYLLAVIVLAVRLGTASGLAGAIGSFLAYDFLFVEPVHTFAVVDAGEWLNLLLLLLVGVVVGRLAGQQRLRADAAEIREREARGHYAVSRAIATGDPAGSALQSIVELLRAEARMTRVWIGLLAGTPLERVVADTGWEGAPEQGTRHAVLRRPDGSARPRWVGVHLPGTARRSITSADLAVQRVPIEVDGQPIGSLWTLRSRALGVPSDEETRLLSAAADQVGLALERDRLRAEGTSLEIARASDRMKSALIDSVSHDFRTPLATIRAAAGALLDRPARRTLPEEAPPGSGTDRSVIDPAAVIDRQAAYLDRLVTNLLDLSRIEGGALNPAAKPIALDEAVADTIDRLGTDRDRPVEIDVAASLGPVRADEVHLNAVLTNLLENVVAHTPPGTPIRVSATAAEAGFVRMTVEDAGPGVPDGHLERIFEKFERGPGSARGSGIGLAVVRGLVEAGGGRVRARASELGGLAIDVDLAAARPFPEAAVPVT